MNIKYLAKRSIWLSNIQGLTSLMLAITLFIISAPFVRWLDPTAGVYDAGFLQRILLGAVTFFAVRAFAWFGFQQDFKTCDKFIDSNRKGFSAKWREFLSHSPPPTILLFIVALIIFEMLLAFACIAITPV